MSEELTEPAGVEPADVSGELPATDAPGATISICPACGTRYDEPTECANGHAPTATVEYDRETVSKADAGDADAIASVGETAATAAGNLAGVVPTEATPPAVAPDPAVAAASAAGVDPAAPAAAVTPAAPAAPAAAAAPAAPAAPELGGVAHALAQLEAAIAGARNTLGITG